LPDHRAERASSAIFGRISRCDFTLGGPCPHRTADLAASGSADD
jgi:hypothetical protein